MAGRTWLPVLNGIASRMLELAGAAFAPRRTLARITECHSTVAGLGDPFDGYTIVVLSDFHHRHPFEDLRWLRHAVHSANAVSPDLVALLGDYASSFKKTPVVSRRWYARHCPPWQANSVDCAHGMVWLPCQATTTTTQMLRSYENGCTRLALTCS